MAILTKEDFIKRVNEKIGDDTSDEAIAFLEDMTDTINDLSEKTSDSTDWKKKYEDNDKAWREKYRERFNSGSSNGNNNGGSDDSDDNDDNDEPPAPKTFDELFAKEK